MQKNSQAIHWVTTNIRRLQKDLTCPFLTWPLGWANAQPAAYINHTKFQRITHKGWDRIYITTHRLSSPSQTGCPTPMTTLTQIKGFEIQGQIQGRGTRFFSTSRTSNELTPLNLISFVSFILNRGSFFSTKPHNVRLILVRILFSCTLLIIHILFNKRCWSC